MKNYLKSDRIPFYELSMTKKATFDMVLKHLTEFFEYKNSKKGRLLIEDAIISGLKLTQTLEELDIKNGQVIYVEFLQSNNTWPTDEHRDKNIPDTAPSGIGFGKTIGLYNLGNTCYMNSAMQCLVNIKLFHEYYVKDKIYMRQLNIENRMGHKGELVMNFANLI